MSLREKAARFGIEVISLSDEYALDIRSDEDIADGVPCFHCGGGYEHINGCRAKRWRPEDEES